MDNKFAVALHAMVMISETDEVMTSDKIAKSVQTNASYIRKIMMTLKTAQLIQSSQGVSGIRLGRDKHEISLFDIYQAVQQTDWVNLFDIHQNPNEECPVGRYIEQTLTPTFVDIEQEIVNRLKAETLAQLIERMYEIGKAENKGV